LDVFTSDVIGRFSKQNDRIYELDMELFQFG